jgi:Flp pilus assembly protein CpaB
MPVSPSMRLARARLRRSPVTWWVATLALALATGLIAQVALARVIRARDGFGPMRSVPGVVVAVEAGEPVSGSSVAMRARPLGTIPEGAVALDVSGRTALVPLVPGEVLLASKLAPDGLHGAAALLPPGTRAVAIPSGPGGRPPARVGDRVDLLATFADTAEGSDPTVLVAAAALVVDVDKDADTVTVAVTAADARAVAYAITAGTITIALAPAS